MLFRWFNQDIRLIHKKSSPDIKNPAFGVEAAFGLLRGFLLPEGAHIAFHGRDTSLHNIDRLRSGQEIQLSISFIPGKVAPEEFLVQLKQHLDKQENFWQTYLEDEFFEMAQDVTEATNGGAPTEEEIEIEFLTIMPLKSNQFPMGGKAFLSSIRDRFGKLFGEIPHLPDQADTLDLLTHLWHRDEVKHFSRSQNANKQRRDKDAHWRRIIGCRGSLFLRGGSENLLAALRVLEHLHLHDHTNLTGWGHYKIHAPSRPFLDKRIFRSQEIRANTITTLNLNDAPAILSEGLPLDEEDIATAVMQNLADQNWKPQPSEATLLKKPDGTPRQIERLHPLNLIAQQHLLKVLSDAFDRSLSNISAGYRPGRSRDEISVRIRESIRGGLRHVVRTDIESCFPSIAHDKLAACLDSWLPRSDTISRRLLNTFISSPYTLNDITLPRTRGLAQGSPLSPLLTNLYLDRIDRMFESSQCTVIRYADDILILSATRPSAEQALETLSRAVQEVGLALNPKKTTLGTVEEGFMFLGEQFDTTQLEDPIRSLMPQRKPLILTQPYLHLGANGEAVEARCEGRLLDTWPLRRLSEIIVLGRSSISTALLEKCARHRIPVSMALESGYQIATLAPDSRRFHEITARHSLWHENLGDSTRLAYAAQIVCTKLDNYMSLMRIRGEKQGSDALNALNEARKGVLAAQDLSKIRGHEGQAARVTFRWLQKQVLPHGEKHFAARRRERGAPDRLNSMLNFGYYLLFTRINALLRSHGLNPYLGLLHDGQDDYETLVADMQEPFRAHVDRIIIRLINRQQITQDSFTDTQGQHRLTRAALKTFTDEFERMMGELIGGVVVRDALLAQVRSLRKAVLGEGSFWLYTWQDRPKKTNSGQPAADTTEGDPNEGST